MKRLDALASLATLALARCGGGGPSPQPLPPGPRPIPSVEIHFADGNHSAQLDLVAQAGIKMVRMDLAADWIASGGWSGYDALLAAAEARAMRVLLITPYQNTADPIAYGNLLATAAGRYPGAMWEILNEPDNAGIWGAYRPAPWSPSEYAAFAIAAATAIRSTNPGATILSGGTSFLSPSWIGDLVGAGLYESGRCNGCGIHAYGETPTTLAGKLQSIVAVLPPAVRVFTTELGIADVGQQAQYLADMWDAHQRFGLAMMNWYELEDGSGGVAGDPSTFGLLGADGVTPKAAYVAWKGLLAGTRTGAT